MPNFPKYRLTRAIATGPFFINAERAGVRYSIPATLQNVDCELFLADWIAGVEVRDLSNNLFPYSLPNRATLGI